MRPTALSRFMTLSTRARFVPVVLLALALGGGCGGDSAAPSAPTPATPAPTPPPEPAPPPEPPAVPTGLRISATGEDFIEWSWIPVADVSGYDVQFSANEAFTDEDEIIGRTAEQISYRREGLAAETSAYLRVRSASGGGSERIMSAWSTHVTGMTRAPAPGAGAGTATFREGDRIPNFPTGIPNVTSGGSVTLSGGVVTITLRRDGYVEYPEHRYTCDASQCGIRGGLVTAGVIVRTATGGGGTPNRAPRAVGSVPDQTLTEDGSATTVNVSARFSDPDGDTLSYRATSSRTSVVRTSVSGSRVTLTPRDAGTATVTVTATDPGGLSATQRFTVTVNASGGGEGAATFREGDRIPNFPTGIPNVTSGGSFLLSGGVVTITLRRDGYVEYPEHRYTCDASQCGIRGGLVTAGVIVRTATGGGGTPNRAPRAVGSVPDQTLTEDGSATTVNVSARFSDPDGDTLSYRATSSRTSVVRTSVSGSRVTLTPRDAGTATVTVTATDPGGLSATQRFTVTVEPPATQPGGTCTVGLLLRPGERCTYPGTSDELTINADGSATFLFFTSGRSLNIVNSNINGRVYTLVATRQSDGRWRIERVGDDGGSPTSPTGDDCSIEDLGTLGSTALTRSGSLERDCESQNENGKLARYYSFRVSDAREVQIDLESSAFDPLLVLRQGSGISGRQIERDDDGGTGNNARIVRELSAGVYALEATSFRRDTTGAFTIRVARTGRSGQPTGDAIVSAGDLECSVREQIAGTGVVNASVSGRLRAVRSVSFVTVTGVLTERDGDRETHLLVPDFLGGMEAGETKSFSSSGIFSTNATRFGCSANWEATEARQTGQGSIRMDATHTISKSPPR